MGGSVSTNHKSSNKIELSWFSQQFSNFLVFWPDPTHQPTHPPTHPPNYTPTHGWGSLHRFQIFKQNWNISISSSAIEFWMIPGVPPWGVGGVGGWGWGVVRGCIPPTCTCTRMHARSRARTHVWHHREFPGIPPMGAAICMKLSCFSPCVCVRARACMCVHVHVCRVHPPTTSQPPSTHPPHPKSRREPKTPKFNKSWTNRDNSILFEDYLPLNIPELI